MTINASPSNNNSTDPQNLSLSYTYSSISGNPSSVTWNCSKLGENIETLNVSNGSVSATCTSVITVLDVTAPTAVCQDISVYSDINGVGHFAASDIDNGSMDECAGSNVDLSLDMTTANCSGLGLNTIVTLTVEDAQDNSSTCTAEVSVEDNIPPTVTCHDVTTTISTGGVNIQLVNYSSLVTASDNCSGIAPIFGSYAVGCGNIGANPVVITVHESFGNLSSKCTATVTVRENTPPVAKCKSATVYLNASGWVSDLRSAIDDGSSDNCGIGSHSVAPGTLTCAALDSPQNVSLQVSDVSGNQHS